MKRESRAKRAGLRAVWASVALHAASVGALLLLLRTSDERKPAQPGIDTRAASEPQVRMSLTETTVNLEDPAPAAPPEIAPPSPPTPAPAKPQAAEPTEPLVASRAATQTLPPELVARIRNSVPASGAANVVIADPKVKSAGGPVPAPGTPAIHGALKAGQTVVYVLDCSGSMGAAGKLDAARAALVSTLRQQPVTVRFQVIIYAGSASPLLVTDGAALPANEANVRAAVEKLAALEPRGKSNHLAAVRAALAFRPDAILLLTDADDLSAAALKPVLASAPKPVMACVGRCTPEGVQPPRELK